MIGTINSGISYKLRYMYMYMYMYDICICICMIYAGGDGMLLQLNEKFSEKIKKIS
jgi:hypothetical protein